MLSCIALHGSKQRRSPHVRDARTNSYDRVCELRARVCVCSVFTFHRHTCFPFYGRVVSVSLCFYAVRMRVVFTLRKPAVDFYRYSFHMFQQMQYTYRYEAVNHVDMIIAKNMKEKLRQPAASTMAKSMV